MDIFGEFMKILIVEDDLLIAKGLSFSLREEGYEVIEVHCLKDALEKLENVDLIVLDVMLPDGESFSFCKQVKEEQKIPVIFLTAKDEEEDVVYGFDMGADDYVIKPFRIRELISRINRLTKRDAIVTCQGITLDMSRSKVLKDGVEIILTSLEYRILSFFFMNLNQVLTRELLLSKIWDDQGNFVNDNTLTVYIKRIRQKLGEHVIQTVKGIGYECVEK